MPGAAVVFNADRRTARRLRGVDDRRRRWCSRAPTDGDGPRRDRPGTYLITFEGPGKKDAIAVHAFVMVPATEVEETAC